MTVVLKTPWAGHPAGATLTLSDYDEQALVRGGAAVFAGGVVRGGGGLVGERASEQAAPLFAPVTKPAAVPTRKTSSNIPDAPRRRGRPPKPKA